MTGRYLAAILGSTLLAGGLAWAVPASAQASGETAEQVAALFGSRATVLDISLSPSGNQLAYITPGANSTELINVVDLAVEGAQPRSILRYDDATSELASCDWASEAHLVCQVYGTVEDAGYTFSFTRMVSVAADGQGTRMLTARDATNALGG